MVEGYRDARAQISTLARYIGFGLIGLYVAMMSAKEEFLKALAADHQSALVFCAACGALTVLADYATYLWRSQTYETIVRQYDDDPDQLKLKDTGDPDGQYIQFDPESWSYNFAKYAFGAKQFFALTGSVIVVYIFAHQLVKSIFL